MASASYRTEVRKELKEHSERMAQLEGTQKAMAEHISEMKPKVDHLEDRNNQTIGALHLGRWIWTVVAGGAGAGLVTLAQYLTGNHPLPK